MAILLIIIYVAFISLGLPDAMLGAAWPKIYLDLNIDIAVVGLYSVLVSIGTVVSSFASGILITRFGTGKVTSFSVILTAIGMLGISLSTSFWMICFFALPLGLGAGAVDAGLNGFVALHYKASHMNWLHSFWGLGATLGPIVISILFANQLGWRLGFIIISVIQFVLALILFISHRLWEAVEKSTNKEPAKDKKSYTIIALLKIPGVAPAVFSFLFYCAVEMTMGLWAATYLVKVEGLIENTAAAWAGMFFLALTVGRILAGFLASKFSNQQLLYTGQALCAVGAILLFIPNAYFKLISIITIGLGAAPIFPMMIHETPKRFGEDLSQAIIGMQMGFAYIGFTLLPPVFGLFAKIINFEILPYFIIFFTVLLFVMTKKVQTITSRRLSG